MVKVMAEEEFKKIIDKGETDTVEFKSWVKARNMKEIISLAVDELIAFANSKGGEQFILAQRIIQLKLQDAIETMTGSV